MNILCLNLLSNDTIDDYPLNIIPKALQIDQSRDLI